jgi:LacI family gluconate utilization system Gnt-I transcriptional repressor
VQSLLALRPAAIVLTGRQHSKGTTLMLRRAGVTIIEIMDSDGTPIDVSIGMSHRRAAKASAEYLLRRGYRRFGYVGHEGEHRDLRAHRRRASFLEAVSAAGADVLHEEIESGASSVPAGRATLARLLAKQPNIEAVYFSNDDMAIGGAHHCLANGISTPDDVALFGFNGLDIGQTMAKPLSTLLTYRYEIGALAGRAILTLIVAPQPSGPSQRVGNAGLRVFDIRNPYQPAGIGALVPLPPTQMMDIRPGARASSISRISSSFAISSSIARIRTPARTSWK